MTDRELLEHILYELRLANWQRAGGKRSGSEPPTPPDVADETTVRTFGGKSYTINTVDTDEALKQLRRQDGSGAA